jgi:hypothetical protein
VTAKTWPLVPEEPVISLTLPEIETPAPSVVDTVVAVPALIAVVAVPVISIS